MRIHTNATLEQVRNAIRTMPTVYAERLSEHRSNTHARAFELNLSGSGRHGGQYGIRGSQSATWDEWGVVMAAIFKADPTTRMGGSQRQPIYADADDYHWQTGNRFVNGIPSDMHIQHKWEWQGRSVTDSYSVSQCKGSKGQPCSAIKRWEFRS